MKWGVGGLNIDECRVATTDNVDARKGHSGFAVKDNKVNRPLITQDQGRFPANIIFDEQAAEMLDEQSGNLKSGGYPPEGAKKISKNCYSDWGPTGVPKFKANEGGASRFFYVSKASKSERGESNNHPTVKPIKLMTYLVRLITPPGGGVLDPFMGSGTTAISSKTEDFNFIGIEKEKEYFDIAINRIKNFYKKEKEE